MSEEFKNPQIHIPDSPKLRAAKERADRIVETAQLNEALRVVKNLLEEVATMQIASRFSPDKKIFSDIAAPGNLNPALRGLSESEHKREQLELDLRRIADQITMAVTNLRNIVWDIEATKTEG